jgi:type I restriction enzyme S subunit
MKIKKFKIKNFSLKSMRNYKSYLPTINEQEKIVEDLIYFENEIIQLEFHYQQKLTNLEELKKSILQKAFNGELTE